MLETRCSSHCSLQAQTFLSIMVVPVRSTVQIINVIELIQITLDFPGFISFLNEIRGLGVALNLSKIVIINFNTAEMIASCPTFPAASVKLSK